MAQRRSGTTRRKRQARRPRREGEARAVSVARESASELARLTRERVSTTRTAALQSVERMRGLRDQARGAMQPQTYPVPHLSLVRAPSVPIAQGAMGQEIRVASYNVHRWTGINGRAGPDAARAGFVISEIDADVIALQEVLRPGDGDDPLEALCESLGLHLAFAATRMHRRGELGNAILSRYPITAISVLDISYSRIERRGALAAQFEGPNGSLGIVATHLSLVDRTRHRQVQMLLEHPQLNAGPAVLVGDMNAWRKCKASQNLDDSLSRHNNARWPATFPAARPLLALDRIYAKGAEVLEIEAHDTAASRRASDHLPVIALIEVGKDA